MELLFDTLGNIIENGDSIIPPKAYSGTGAFPVGWCTQGSLILPKEVMDCIMYLHQQ